MYLISYAHTHDGNFYHGTLSSIDGITTTSWSFDAGNERQTLDVPLTAARFQKLWSIFKTSPYFASCVIRNPDSVIDPDTHHIIDAAFNLQGRQGNVLSAIPADSDHPEFKQWMTLLDMPLQASPHNL